jgi:uncharacterized coiled-coil protein SlyX
VNRWHRKKEGRIEFTLGASSKVAEQQNTIAELKATVAQQQKQIEALTAGLQKVSAAVELNKAAPTQVADNR